MEVGGSLRRQSSLVADSLRGAPSLLVDPSTGPAPGGQNWGNSMIESGEIPLILVDANEGGTFDTAHEIFRWQVFNDDGGNLDLDYSFIGGQNAWQDPSKELAQV